MLDIGVTKLMIIGGIALVVIGPERLPRLARMAGTLLGRAQRYVSDVKAEVSRSIELEELNKMKQQFETSARDVESAVHGHLNQATDDLNRSISDPLGYADGHDDDALSPVEPYVWEPPAPSYQRPNKKWRVKRGAVPRWYKQREGVRQHVQSGAARVARHRPRPRRLDPTF